MKKLRLNFTDYDNTEVLSREQLKRIMGGDGSGNGACYKVYSDQGYQSCWYTTGSPLDLCNRVYGNHCEAHSDGPVDCSVNNCTMN